MKNIFYIALVLLVGFSACKKKQGDVVANALKKSEETNKKLKDYIQKHVDDITSRANGTITGYYRDDEVKKIYGEHFTDTSRAFTEYYFDEGYLILITRQDFKYNMPASYTEEKAKANGDSVWYDDKKTRLELSSFYFSDNKLVKWIAPDRKEVDAKSIQFINMESRLWAETLVLMKELKEQ